MWKILFLIRQLETIPIVFISRVAGGRRSFSAHLVVTLVAVILISKRESQVVNRSQRSDMMANSSNDDVRLRNTVNGRLVTMVVMGDWWIITGYCEMHHSPNLCVSSSVLDVNSVCHLHMPVSHHNFITSPSLRLRSRSHSRSHSGFNFNFELWESFLRVDRLCS
jgi:hypothetical protein